MLSSYTAFLPYFYPRPPRGGRPSSSGLTLWLCEFLSTSSARRTTGARQKSARDGGISIHVLREEDDMCNLIASRTAISISIHVLREEDDRRACPF